MASSRRAVQQPLKTSMLLLASVHITSAMAAGATPSAACAPDAVGLPATEWPQARSEPARVRPSALFSAPDEAVYESQGGVGSSAYTTLSTGGAADSQHAFVLMRGAEGGRNLLAFRLVEGSGDGAAKLRLGRLEHLYAFVFRQPPQTRFSLSPEASKARSVGQRVVSQPGLLKEIAGWRECAANEVKRLFPSAHLRTWTLPEIDPLNPGRKPGLLVSARIKAPSHVPNGGTLSFARGAHLACSGTLDRHGIGSCTLFDSHGHDHHDDESHAPEPTFITFSGSVGPERIVLPITAIVPPGSITHRR